MKAVESDSSGTESEDSRAPDALPVRPNKSSSSFLSPASAANKHNSSPTPRGQSSMFPRSTASNLLCGESSSRMLFWPNMEIAADA